MNLKLSGWNRDLWLQNQVNQEKQKKQTQVEGALIFAETCVPWYQHPNISQQCEVHGPICFILWGLSES